MKQKDILSRIAMDHLFVDTLKTRGSDRLDFHEVSVWGIKSALDAAFKAGAEKGMAPPPPSRRPPPRPQKSPPAGGPPSPPG